MPGTVGQRIAVVLLLVAVLAEVAAQLGTRHPAAPVSGGIGFPVPAPLFGSVAGFDAQPHRTSGLSPPGRHVWVRHVLVVLDKRRSSAWRAGKPRLLRAVYSPGSRILAEDRRMLSEYGERGLRVRGVHLYFERLRVLVHRAGVVRLRVVDRLSAVVAAPPDGRALQLPSDQPTRHKIVLRRQSNGWRIARVDAV